MPPSRSGISISIYRDNMDNEHLIWSILNYPITHSYFMILFMHLHIHEEHIFFNWQSSKGTDQSS